MKKVLGCLLFLAAASASAQVILKFPSTSGDVPNQTAVDAASQYVDMTGASKVAIRVEFDAGVSGTVYLECVKNEAATTTEPADTPTVCGSSAIPFPDHSNLADTFRIASPIGKVRVRFVSLVGTDATHVVRASYQAGK